jgi:hypothetical protein
MILTTISTILGSTDTLRAGSALTTSGILQAGARRVFGLEAFTLALHHTTTASAVTGSGTPTRS